MIIKTKKDQLKYYLEIMKFPAWQKLRKKKVCKYCLKRYSFKQYFMSYPIKHFFIQKNLISLSSRFKSGRRCPKCRLKRK